MLDRYVWGTASRLSPEAPVPVLRYERETSVPGGAANVARNLASLGAKVVLFAMVGVDLHGLALEALLESQVTCGMLKTSGNTTTKTRFIAGGHHLLRVDNDVTSYPEPDVVALVKRVGSFVKEFNPAAVVISDYGKGLLSEAVRLDARWVRQLCKQTFVSVNTKNFKLVERAFPQLVVFNRVEFMHAFAISTDDEIVKRLRKLGKDQIVVVTLGEHGMYCACGHDRHRGKVWHVPTVAREVCDVSGAGDTALAAFTLAIKAQATPVEATLLANYAAGVVVGKVGTAEVTVSELLEYHRTFPDRQRVTEL